jgi:polyphosphate kinase
MINADFLNSDFPAATDLPEVDPTGPSRFFNRELSWLSFNWRVLEEAQNPRVPLLERLRFLSISANNLDEFYNVRVAGLRELKHAGNNTPADDGLNPAEQLVEINEDARKLLQSQQANYVNLRKALEAENISILDNSKLTDADKTYLDEIFLNRVFAVLSPLAIDPAHPFPFIPNLGYTLALQLQRSKDKRPLQVLLPVPHQIDRFVFLPAPEGTHRVLPLEELLILHLGGIFPGYKYDDC